MRSSSEVGIPAGTAECVMLTVCILPPSWLTFLICGENYIYWVLRNNSSIHGVVVTQSRDTLVLIATSLHHLQHLFIISNIISLRLLTPRRVSWTFLGFHHASSRLGPLGFLELFSNPPLSVFSHLSWGPASRLAITRTIWSEQTRAWWLPPLSQLNFECIWLPLTGSASHLTVPRTIWSEWTRSGLSPLACCISPTLRVFVGQFTYIIYCAFIIHFCIPMRFSSFSFFS
jgi:hypothetical protein